MRPAFARICLPSLRHNYARARQLHGGRALAVLKAHAYGHGAVACARALSELAGILTWPQARRDWARPGLMLYGAGPLPGASCGPRPVMRLSSEVFAVYTLLSGQVPGYGASFVASAMSLASALVSCPQ